MDLTLADKLRDLKLKKTQFESHVKEINAEIRNTEEQLYSDMMTEELQSFKKDGTLFYLSFKTYASPTAKMRERLCQTLKDNGYGDIVKETVNSNTLSAFVKEQEEENNDELPEWLNGLVNVYEKPSIGMRKAK